MTALTPGPLIARGRTAEVFELSGDRVLKLMLPDMPKEVGEWEIRAGRVISESRLDAPKLLETTQVDGRLGLVYERVHGPSMLQAIQARPWRTGKLAGQLARLHVQMHSASAAGTELPRIKESIRGMISRSSWVSEPLRAATFERLDRLPDSDAILHYDLHPGNVIMTAAGPRVIDWMTVQQGDPAADVARTIYLMRDTGIQPGTPRLEGLAIRLLRGWFLRSYLRTYRRLRKLDDAAVAAWRPVMLAGRLAEGIENERAGILRELSEG